MKKTVALLGIVVFFFSCDVAKQLAGTYALTQCKYIFQSITGLSLGGINFQNVSSLSSLNAMDAVNLVAAFSTSGGSLPLNFTMNLGVTNPGTQTALLNGAGYILEIDGMEMTQGSVNNQVQIGSGQTMTMPITMGFDLKKVMSGHTLDAIKNLAFNFVGIGSGASNVTVKLKPSFVVGGSTINTPDYIPISFTLNK